MFSESDNENSDLLGLPGNLVYYANVAYSYSIGILQALEFLYVIFGKRSGVLLEYFKC